MEKEDKLRYLAGILLIISAITHNIQLFIHGFSLEQQQIQAAIYGTSYAIFGILLIKYKESKIILLLCIFFPALGGILGIRRFILLINYNYFIIFHVIVDIIVISICIHLYFNMKKSERTPITQ